MTCLRASQLYAYLEDDLEPRERRFVEEHLALCPACRAALEERKVLEEAWRSLPPLEVPPGLAQAVLSRIPRRRAFLPAWLASLGAGIVFLLLSFLGFTLAGGTLVEFLIASRKLLMDSAGQVVIFGGKSARLVLLFVGGLGDLLRAAWSGLAFIPRLLGPEILILSVFAGILLSGLAVAGFRKIILAGEKS